MGIILAVLAILLFASACVLIERQYGLFSMFLRIADLQEGSLLAGLLGQ